MVFHLMLKRWVEIGLIAGDGKGHETHQLAAACILLALKHGRVPELAVGSFLDTLMSQQRFAQLPTQLQQMLLTGLPEVLSSLSAQRSTAVISMLCSLDPISSLNLNLKLMPEGANKLSTAAWVGLARYMRINSTSDSSQAAAAAVTNAVHSAIQQLLQQLPSPPFLLPKEALPTPHQDLDVALKSMHSVSDAQHSNKADVNAANSFSLQYQSWGAAIACLQAFPRDKVACLKLPLLQCQLAKPPKEPIVCCCSVTNPWCHHSHCIHCYIVLVMTQHPGAFECHTQSSLLHSCMVQLYQALAHCPKALGCRQRICSGSVCKLFNQ